MNGWARPGRVARPGLGAWQDGDAYVHDRGWQGCGETAAGGLAGAGATLFLKSAHPPAAALARLHRGAAGAERSGPGVSGRSGAGSAAVPGRRATAPAPPPLRGHRGPHVSPRESGERGSWLPAEAPSPPRARAAAAGHKGAVGAGTTPELGSCWPPIRLQQVCSTRKAETRAGSGGGAAWPPPGTRREPS